MTPDLAKAMALRTLAEPDQLAEHVLNKTWLLFEANASTPFYISDNPVSLQNEDKSLGPIAESCLASGGKVYELAAKMTSASGQAKVDATAAAVGEIVAQRKSMRESMMKMHHEMMGHMAEDMQAGAGSMAMCPMMKDMGAMKLKKS